MQSAQLEELERIARELGALPSRDEDALKLPVPAADGWTCEITVPFGIREWFVSVRDADGREVATDWTEHYGLDGETDAELDQEMRFEVVRVMELVAGARFVVEEGRTELAILVDGVSVSVF